MYIGLIIKASIFELAFENFLNPHDAIELYLHFDTNVYYVLSSYSRTKKRRSMLAYSRYHSRIKGHAVLLKAGQLVFDNIR